MFLSAVKFCFRNLVCHCLLQNKVKQSQNTAMTVKYNSMDAVVCLTRNLKAFTRDAYTIG